MGYGGRVGPRVGSGRVRLFVGNRGSGQVNVSSGRVGSGRIGSKKSDPWATLTHPCTNRAQRSLSLISRPAHAMCR